jgi:hypothetical protein
MVEPNPVSVSLGWAALGELVLNIFFFGELALGEALGEVALGEGDTLEDDGGMAPEAGGFPADWPQAASTTIAARPTTGNAILRETSNTLLFII